MSVQWAVTRLLTLGICGLVGWLCGLGGLRYGMEGDFCCSIVRHFHCCCIKISSFEKIEKATITSLL